MRIDVGIPVARKMFRGTEDPGLSIPTQHRQAIVRHLFRVRPKGTDADDWVVGVAVDIDNWREVQVKPQVF
jgi:hypothetical protein